MTETITREGNIAHVKMGNDYNYPGDTLVTVEDTGNGYIAHFKSYSSMAQDYYVCLDYAQAYDLVLGLSMFKKELGFA